MDRESDGRKERDDDWRGDQGDNEHADPPRGRRRVRSPEEKRDASDRGHGQHRIPAPRSYKTATEAFQIESAESRRLEPVGCHPGQQTECNRSSGDQGDAGAPQIGPVASRDESCPVGCEHGCGQRVREWEYRGGKRVGNPAPTTAPLESNDEEQGCDDDAEYSEGRRPRLARDLHDACVYCESHSRDDSRNAPEQHRAEDHEKSRREGDGDCRWEADRAFINTEGCRKAEQQQLSCLPRVVVDDRRDDGSERTICRLERRSLSGCERSSSERDRAQRERSEADSYRRKSPRERGGRAG